MVDRIPFANDIFGKRKQVVSVFAEVLQDFFRFVLLNPFIAPRLEVSPNQGVPQLM